MSGNAVDDGRVYANLLRGLQDDSACCDFCGGHLPDHEWADLAPDGTVVDCSGQVR